MCWSLLRAPPQATPALAVSDHLATAFDKMQEESKADVAVQVVMPSDEHIARHESKHNPKPHAPTRVTLAFGNLAQPVLVEKMGSADDDIVKNALAAAVRLLKVPQNVFKSVSAGSMPVLTGLTQHADPIIRRRATKALELILLNSYARTAAASSSKIVAAWAAVLDDTDVQVRLNMAQGLVNFSSKMVGADFLVESGYVKILVRKAGTEEDARVQRLVLTALNSCTNTIGGKGLADSLAHGAARCCIALLKHKEAEIRAMVCLRCARYGISCTGLTMCVLRCRRPTISRRWPFPRKGSNRRFWAGQCHCC